MTQEAIVDKIKRKISEETENYKRALYDENKNAMLFYDGCRTTLKELLDEID
jgi:hypothetical protein